MLRLGNDQKPFRLDRLPENIGGGRSQLLLRRGATSQRFDYPRQMRKAGNFFVGRNIGDMRLAKKWQKVMLAY